MVGDITQNYNEFGEKNLKKVISQFQNNLLSIRQKDNELKSALDPLTADQIDDITEQLGIYLLSSPKDKNKLASLMNSLILLTHKKNEFLELVKSIEPIKPVKPVKSAPSAPSKKQKTTISTFNHADLRDKWLKTKTPGDLEAELLKINMNELRNIVKPWNIKPIGRKKIDLIIGIIEYLNKMS